MDIIKEYKNEIMSTIFAIISIIFLAYMAYYRPLSTYNDKLTLSIKKSENEIKNFVTKIYKNGQNRVQKIDTDLLSDINNIYEKESVEILSLNPSNNMLPISFEAYYNQLLNIIHKIEELNTTIIKNLNIKLSPINSKLIISVTTLKGHPNHKIIKELLEKNITKNPFVSENNFSINDLNQYTITGIGKINNEYIATIDNIDYQINSEFKHHNICMIVKDITDNEIILLGEDNKTYKIHMKEEE